MQTYCNAVGLTLETGVIGASGLNYGDLTLHADTDEVRFSDDAGGVVFSLPAARIKEATNPGRHELELKIDPEGDMGDEVLRDVRFYVAPKLPQGAFVVQEARAEEVRDELL